MTSELYYFVLSVLAFAASNNSCENTHHHRKGYATSCWYRIPGASYNAPVWVREDTPCITLNKRGTKPVDDAGLCRHGRCVPYYRLKDQEPGVVEKVFAHRFHKCPNKRHQWPRPVRSCYYYCEIRGHWYYGLYVRNTRCRGASPHPVGYCCYGKCYTRMEFCEK
ncbi:uncharacterized protein LOC144143394 [Haemaphysalis longicornis]